MIVRGWGGRRCSVPENDPGFRFLRAVERLQAVVGYFWDPGSTKTHPRAKKALSVDSAPVQLSEQVKQATGRDQPVRNRLGRNSRSARSAR